ncbi:MAG: hypothetical protein AAGC71_11275 [Pseudomonadota bacterium]
MNYARLLITIVAALLAQACTIQKPQITADAIDFNEAVENTNNQVTFLNVLRSYHRAPRHYTSISDIKGNFTVVANGALASTLATSRQVGAEVTGGVTNTTTSTAGNSLNPSIGASYQTNPNYTIAVLESQDFYNGILKPIDLGALTLFRQQGWYSSFLANLLFEDLVLIIKNDQYRMVVKFVNDPKSAGWRYVADKITLRTYDGESSERVIARTNTIDLAGIAKLAEQGIKIRRCKDDDKNKACSGVYEYLVYKDVPASVGLEVDFDLALNSSFLDETANNTPAAQYIRDRYKQGQCFTIPSDDEEKAQPLLLSHDLSGGGCLKMVETFMDNCGMYFSFQKNLIASRSLGRAIEDEEGADVPPICKNAELHLNTRSTDGIVYYVGEYIEAVAEDKNNTIWIGDRDPATEKRDGSLQISPYGRPLFVVTENEKTEAALSAKFQGSTFFIPKGDEGGRSLQVLGFIQQLVNLNKKSEDLPKAQLIQIQ